MIPELVCVRAIHNYEVGAVIRAEDDERYRRLYWHSVVERELPGKIDDAAESMSEVTNAETGIADTETETLDLEVVEAIDLETSGAAEGAGDTTDEESE